MRLRKIETGEFPSVEEFLRNNFSSPTHWPDWNLVVSRHYGSVFFYWGAFDNDRLIGICPVHEAGTKTALLHEWFSGHFKLIPNGGWIFSEKKEINFTELPISANLKYYQVSLPEIEEFNIVYVGQYYKTKTTLLVPLEIDAEDIRKHCIKSKRRNMILKAERSGISVKEMKTTNDLEQFFRLYNMSCERLNLGKLSFDFFMDLFQTVRNIEFNVFMACKDDEQLANIAVISDKSYSIYWLGNNSSGPNSGQGELLQWHAIRSMKQKGCKYYDLCFIEPEKLPHIYMFKSGFSRNQVPVAVYHRSSLYYRILNRLSHAFKNR